MFTVDDSGSMGWDYLPDWVVWNLSGLFYCRDNRQCGGLNFDTIGLVAVSGELHTLQADRSTASQQRLQQDLLQSHRDLQLRKEVRRHRPSVRGNQYRMHWTLDQCLHECVHRLPESEQRDHQSCADGHHRLHHSGDVGPLRSDKRSTRHRSVAGRTRHSLVPEAGRAHGCRLSDRRRRWVRVSPQRPGVFRNHRRWHNDPGRKRRLQLSERRRDDVWCRAGLPVCLSGHRLRLSVLLQDCRRLVLFGSDQRIWHDRLRHAPGFRVHQVRALFRHRERWRPRSRCDGVHARRHRAAVDIIHRVPREWETRRQPKRNRADVCAGDGELRQVVRVLSNADAGDEDRWSASHSRHSRRRIPGSACTRYGRTIRYF